MLAVYNKGGNLLDILSAENAVESFLVKQQSARPGRVAMAIGLQDNEGKLHIIRTQADLESMDDGQELRDAEESMNYGNACKVCARL